MIKQKTGTKAKQLYQKENVSIGMTRNKKIIISYEYELESIVNPKPVILTEVIMLDKDEAKWIGENLLKIINNIK